MALLPSHSPHLEKGLPSSEVPKAFAVGVSMDPELWVLSRFRVAWPPPVPRFPLQQDLALKS